MRRICPECYAEYRQQIVACSDCDVALIDVEGQISERGQYKYLGGRYRRESYGELRSYPWRFAKAFIKWVPAIALWVFLQYLSIKWAGINLPQIILSIAGFLLFWWKVFKDAGAKKMHQVSSDKAQVIEPIISRLPDQ